MKSRLEDIVPTYRNISELDESNLELVYFILGNLDKFSTNLL